MKKRMVVKDVEPGVYAAMAAAEKQISRFTIDPKLRELIRIRVSQINGCGFCLNMHTKDARKLGETEQRLNTLAAWWETSFFTETEQAALRFAEEVTRISNHGVSDAVYEQAVALLGEQQVTQLLLVIITINSWNRIAVASHLLPTED